MWKLKIYVDGETIIEEGEYFSTVFCKLWDWVDKSEKPRKVEIFEDDATI